MTTTANGRTFPEPYEDVVGKRRSDRLLSLDKRSESTRAMIRAYAYHLRTALGVGDPAPVVARMYERLRNVELGDLVVEQSTMYRHTFGDGGGEIGPKSVGILVAHREEWWTTEVEWHARLHEERAYQEERYPGEPVAIDDERRTDDAWYVQYGPQPGDICRWTNCSFFAVPMTMERFDVPAGRADGTATVITRDSLLASLADSGFRLRGME